MKIVGVNAPDKRFDKYRATKMQAFQIALAGVEIRTTYVEN